MKISPFSCFELSLEGGCQTNANQSQLFANEEVLGGEKVAPLTKGGVTHCLEPVPSIDIPLKTEVIVH